MTARVVAHWPDSALVFVDEVRVRVRRTTERTRWRCDDCGEGSTADHCPHTRATVDALLDPAHRQEKNMPFPDDMLREIPDELLRGRQRRHLVPWLESRGWRPTLMQLESERDRRDRRRGARP